MKFGPASLADAIGGVTVHTLRQGALVLKKGTTIGPDEVEALTRAGVKDVVVVRLEDGDVSEDVAAASIAQAVAGEGVNVERAFTGRANLFAARPGVLVVDRAAVDRINGVDEAITFATLAAYKPVVEGEMIATVKLIPFGVEGRLRDAAVAVAGRDTLRIAPYVIKKVGVVSTLLPGLAPKVIDKTLRVTAERLAPAGATIIAERRVPHDETVLAASIKELLGLGAELVIVFGASAIADRRDVIPAAITEIGGAVEEGAHAYLRRQFRTLGIFVVLVFARPAGLIWWSGVVFTVLAGVFGLWVDVDMLTLDDPLAALGFFFLPAYQWAVLLPAALIMGVIVGVRRRRRERGDLRDDRETRRTPTGNSFDRG